MFVNKLYIGNDIILENNDNNWLKITCNVLKFWNWNVEIRNNNGVIEYKNDVEWKNIGMGGGGGQLIKKEYVNWLWETKTIILDSDMEIMGKCKIYVYEKTLLNWIQVVKDVTKNYDVIITKKNEIEVTPLINLTSKTVIIYVWN